MTALRLLGAACVVFGCAMRGFFAARGLRQRAEALLSVCETLEMLKSELSELCAPLPEILSRLKTEAPDPCRNWLAALEAQLSAGDVRFAELWRETLNSCPPGGLDGEALHQLALLAPSLGRYDAPEQCCAIERCLRALREAHTRAEERARTQGRLYSGLGVAAGLLLAIVLL